MNVPNHERKAFRDMTPEERSEIVEAWIRGECQRLDVCELGGDWWVDVPNVIADCYVYRTKPRQLVIPWEVIKPTFKWVAIDKNGIPYAYQGDKPELSHDFWMGVVRGDKHSLFALNIDTAGIDWQESLTQRPEGV